MTTLEISDGIKAKWNSVATAVHFLQFDVDNRSHGNQGKEEDEGIDSREERMSERMKRENDKRNDQFWHLRAHPLWEEKQICDHHTIAKSKTPG